LGEYNSQVIFSCPSTVPPNFVEKYPKIKYAAISDRPHKNCETYF
jgi:hypothetical protein